MITLVPLVKRAPGMTVEAFQTHWRTRHADIVRRLPGLRRYVQSPTRLAGYARGEPVWDGIAELWFDDTQALRALAGRPEQAAVDADEARFLDRSATRLLFTEEHVVRDERPPAGSVKSIAFLRRREDLTVEEFQRYWRERHGPVAATIPGLLRYTQDHVRLSSYAGGRSPVYDGIAITWFASTDAMRAAARSPEYARTRADEANFLAGSPPFIIADDLLVAG